ncbi:Uncharacterised protein [Edwardsiella tarda]|uniref:Uncharacterized protein n=1 Tax=Edwardsiella tarda ATCC 15947 = NBRC 105688 TaxID=667121 RepID=A0AC61TFK6_EDWTA|nr:hypothetical protein [Edwardsiella tarda]UAL57489.1 hypothetical protein K8O98_06145 [Edwardsiella tarda]UCP99450.1 hypothetical protein DCL27_12370 [Edwardsiella tarda ATCC 15947 = NBRC 105688]STD30333.1 Uncharacterised protein [Edwardsiella tarda]
MSRIAPYPLRMAPDTREYLEKEAEKAKRSLQQEILYRIDKFRQLEKLLASSSSDGEDMYMQVANALRMERVAEERGKEIDGLKAKLDDMMRSANLSETDRFMAIGTNAVIMEKAIQKIIKSIPRQYLESDSDPKKPT